MEAETETAITLVGERPRLKVIASVEAETLYIVRVGENDVLRLKVIASVEAETSNFSRKRPTLKPRLKVIASVEAET